MCAFIPSNMCFEHGRRAAIGCVERDPPRLWDARDSPAAPIVVCGEVEVGECCVEVVEERLAAKALITLFADSLRHTQVHQCERRLVDAACGGEY